MTAFKLQFIIAGVISIVLGFALFFWRVIDSSFASEERSEKSVRRIRIFYSILFMAGGIIAILTVLFDWKVAGYIIPRSR